jgi:hypothetical protein
MLKILGSQSNTMVEFRQGPDGTIQTREIPAEPPDSLGPWRNLSRFEMIFYLNCGGVVGLWLEDLRSQGFIQTRQKRRGPSPLPLMGRLSSIKPPKMGSVVDV